MKKRTRIPLVAMLLLFLAVFTGNSTAWGTEESTQAAEGTSPSITGFTYSLIYPENQMDTNLGYYRLKMTPEQQQTISLVLVNSGSEPITVDVALNGAKTNKNGVIEYADNEIENDASLTFAFEDLVTGPGSVDLAAGETKQVDLTIQMPETSFEGVIAGGVQLMKAGQTEDADTSGGSTVINQYAYVISILLQESDVELTPELALNSAYAGQLNYRNAVYANISNVVAAYLNDLTIEAQVMAQGSSTVLYEAKKTSMRMAPNSFMEFPVTMNGAQMEAGMYTIHLTATSGDQNWSWTEDFEITEDEAQKYNERDVGLSQETGIDWTLVLMIVGGFVGFVVIIFILVTVLRKKKKGRKNKKKGNKAGKKKKD